MTYDLRSGESFTGQIIMGRELCEQGPVLSAGEMPNKSGKGLCRQGEGRQMVGKQTKKLRL